MSDQDVVSLRDTTTEGDAQAVGAAYNLDMKDGYVYDEHGNQIDRWKPADEDRTPLLANYMREQHAMRAAYALSQTDPDRARLMLRQYDMDERLITMDLGPTDVHIASAMPNFASGYTNEAPIADLVAPPLLVGKQTDDYFQFAKEDAFQRVSPLQTAGGGEPGEVSPRLSNAQYSAKGRALAGWVSTEVSANEDVPLRILQATMRRVIGALELEREIRVQAKFGVSTAYDSSVVTTLTSGFQWDGGASSDPIKDIHTQMLASWGPITGIVLSWPLFMAFQRNSVVKSYIFAKNSIEPIPNAQRMGPILDLPPIHVGKMQYINDSGVKTYVWGNNALFIRQPLQMPPTDQQDVATGYTFRWSTPKAPNGSVSGGFVVRQFFTENRGALGGQKIVCAHYDDERITSQFAAGLIVNAYQ